MCFSQYCGHTGNPSGPGQCTPPTTMTEPGLTPADSIPPFINGEVSTTVLQFKNYDTIYFGGQALIIQSLVIDSIGNLPSGLCWATNKANNTFAGGENACIKFNGTTCAAPGQYRAILRAYLPGVPIQEPGEGLGFFLRVKNSGDADIPVDTTQTSSNRFIAYGLAAQCAAGITNAIETFNSLTLSPNPCNGKAVVSFFSNKDGTYQQRLTDLTGKEILKREIDVVQGDNQLIVDAKNLAAGVYLYSMSNGVNTITRKLVVEK